MTTVDVQDETWGSSRALAYADDCIVLSQQLGAYVSFAPELEIDMAIGNIALDLLGQARGLYSFFAKVEGEGRTEDDLAMGRDPEEFRNLSLVAQPADDYAQLIARQFFFDVYQLELYRRLAGGCGDLAAIAQKGVREAQYHLDFSQDWVLRLGDGTEESHARMQAGINTMWPFVEEMFVGEDGGEEECGCSDAEADNSPRALWHGVIEATLSAATLDVPTVDQQSGGRAGKHSQFFRDMITEMQVIPRAYPGLEW